MSKTNIGLVDYVKSKLGTPYVYGAKMEVLTKEKYDWLKKTYGSMVWDTDVNKVGKVCCDCSGLISAYTGVLRGSSQYRDAAKQVHSISTVSTAPIGALVWKTGHIGVYVGIENGVPMYIAADGSALGCRKNKLPNVFTHWFLCTDITYPAKTVTSAIPALPTAATPAAQSGAEFTRADVLKAIQELERHGIIISPDYWTANYAKMLHLDRLLVNMSAYLAHGRR